MVKYYKLIFTGPPTRDCADHWDIIDKTIVDAWDDILSSLRLVERQIDDSYVEIRADWQFVHEYMRKSYQSNVELYQKAKGDNIEDSIIRIAEQLDSLLPIVVQIEVSGGLEISKVGLEDIVLFLQDIFLICNLAVPGSLNLYRAEVRDETSNKVEELRLSNGFFESAQIDSLRSAYPPIRNLGIHTVQKWLENLSLGNLQLAENGPVKALFCLLYLSSSEFCDPTDLLWISHGLEGLYSVPSALSFNFLRERLALLLRTPLRKKKFLARQIQEFYKMRNAFVHGGMKIARPHELVEFDEEASKLIHNLDFGSRLLIASLQVMIERGLSQLNFQESLVEDTF